VKMQLRRKCKCGEAHTFEMFKRWKTSYGGVSALYQFFCRKLNKLMFLATSTFPTKLTGMLCPSTALKKFCKTEIIVDSDSYWDSGLYHLGEEDEQK